MAKKKKELTIEEYKEELLDELDETEEFEKPIYEYEEEYIEQLEEIEELESETPKKKNRNRITLIMNIIFSILIIGMIMISIDVICVARYNKGPFFAIKTATYKDGGTKVYHGIGYKVIKYNQIQGRRDMEIGTWGLKYDVNPTTISALDLAIEFTNTPKDTYTKYYKEFLRVNGNYKNKDSKKNTMTFGYVDEDGKYTLDIVCTMAEKESIPELKEKDEITIIGTVTNYDLDKDGTNKTLYISDCFAE